MNEKRAIVAVCRCCAETIAEDYIRLLELANCYTGLSEDKKLLIKVNHSHNKFFPSCSTPPWQLDGVLRWLKDKGICAENILVGENRTLISNLTRVRRSHLWNNVVEHYGVKFCEFPKTYWSRLDVDTTHLSMNWNILGGIYVPAVVLGRDIIHLVPMKVHGHSIITGSMKSAFSIFATYSHCHLVHEHIHEYLVDVLYLQKNVLQCQMIGVIDGSICGDGKGPVTLNPVEKNILLASRDLVALDTIAARMMGINPESIPHIKIAGEQGLGCTDPARIEIRGDRIDNMCFGFKSRKNIVIFTDQLLRKNMGKRIQSLIFETVIARMAILASIIYHNCVWYYFVAVRQIRVFHRNQWGKCFRQYRTRDK